MDKVRRYFSSNRARVLLKGSILPVLSLIVTFLQLFGPLMARGQNSWSVIYHRDCLHYVTDVLTDSPFALKHLVPH